MRPARLTEMRLEDVDVALVDSRRDAPLELVRHELMEAHQGLLDLLARHSSEELRTAVPGRRWSNGSAITLSSVFACRYRGLTHYGGHAEEIETSSRCRCGPITGSSTGA